MAWRWLRSCLRGIEAFLVPDVESSIERSNRLLLVVSNLTILCACLVWGLLFALAQAWWSAAFPWALSVLLPFGIAHLLFTRSPHLCRRVLCYGLLLCSLGFQWSMGGRMDVFQWSMLGPQLAIITGASTSEGTLLLLLCVTGHCALLAACAMLAPDAVTPQPPVGPPICLYLFHALTIIVPGCLVFALVAHIVSRHRGHLRRLQHSLLEAEVMAQHIATLDLDVVIDVDYKRQDERIVELLRNIAMNLKLYRPYIPAHLLLREKPPEADADTASQSASSGVGLPNSVGSTVPSTTGGPGQRPRHSLVSTISGAGTFRVKATAHRAGEGYTDSLPLSGSPRAVPLAARAPATLFKAAALELPQARKKGTLLHVRLHRLADYSEDLADEDVSVSVGCISTMFIEAVMAAVTQTKGVLHTLQHDGCVATWHLFGACPMHAQNACLAAVLIRKALSQLQADHPKAPLAVSMGVWSGPVICGSVGTKDCKAPSLLGHALARCTQLQRYSAASGRSVVANEEAQRLISAAPRSRLLPVDVVSLHTSRTCDDTDPPLTKPPVEILYEVVDDFIPESSEWMYALQHSTAPTGEVDAQVAALVSQLQGGVRNRDAFLNAVRALRQSGDKVVISVCLQLEALALGGHLTRPFFRALPDRWAPDFVTAGPRRRSRNFDVHHQRPFSDNLSTIAEDLDLEDPQPRPLGPT